MSFNTMLAQASVQDQVEILPGWTQGRATFGGVVAAIMLQNMLRQVGPDLPLRSLTISFVAPVAPGWVELQPQVLRQGKSVLQAESKMVQQGQVVAVLLASFGASRHSGIVIAGAPAPAFSAPDACVRFPYIPGVTPEFTGEFDFRWAVGNFPFTSNQSGELAGWIRFKEQDAVPGDQAVLTQPCSIAHFLALVDAWPPSVLQMYTAPAPASSLTWTLELLADPTSHSTSDWWQYWASAENAGQGYAQIAAKCWNQSGELVAITRQSVTVFG